MHLICPRSPLHPCIPVPPLTLRDIDGVECELPQALTPLHIRLRSGGDTACREREREREREKPGREGEVHETSQTHQRELCTWRQTLPRPCTRAEVSSTPHSHLCALLALALARSVRIVPEPAFDPQSFDMTTGDAWHEVSAWVCSARCEQTK